MLEAFQIWEDENSAHHGLPMYMTRSGDPNLSFMVEEVDDLGVAALEKYDEERAKQKNPRKGVSRHLVPVMLDGSPVPDGGIGRDYFYTEMTKNSVDREGSLAQSLLDEGLIERKPKGGYDPNDYG